MEWHLEGDNVIVVDAFTVRDSDAQRWADLMAVRVEIPAKKTKKKEPPGQAARETSHL